MTKKVKYEGSEPTMLPTLGIDVNPGDIIDVPDDFVNGAFSDATVTKTKVKEVDA